MGAISAANSLIHIDLVQGVGIFEATPLPNGNYLVDVANGVEVGTPSVATWVDGATGQTLDGQNTATTMTMMTTTTTQP